MYNCKIYLICHGYHRIILHEISVSYKSKWLNKFRIDARLQCFKSTTYQWNKQTKQNKKHNIHYCATEWLFLLVYHERALVIHHEKQSSCCETQSSQQCGECRSLYYKYLLRSSIIEQSRKLPQFYNIDTFV